MEDIKMTSTKALYAKLKPELDAAFSTVMASMGMEEGQQVQAFAESIVNYLQVQHATPCANGADALQLALLSLQLPVDTEVILPAFGHEAIAATVAAAGLQPVFADVDAQTFTLDPASVERHITPATGAIVAVHQFGQCAPMQELLELAQKYKRWLVEDVTQALGAVYVGEDEKERKAGAIGQVGYTSFFPTKPLLDSGEGGAAFTKQTELAERMQQISQNGRNGRYTFNSRLDTLQAAMLDVKLKYTDEYNEARQEIARFYDNAFAETELVQAPQRATYSSQTYHQYTIQVAPEVRNGLQQHLSDNFIPSAVYYPQPLHLLEKYTSGKYKPGDFPVAELLSESVLSLPMHSELKEDQLAYICLHVLNYVKQNS
ncbi:DegT/DnrJ/EryC1/StrS family aminotransferase [Pontibacter chinhatensis]|uniref:dTDP-4-amino-4,6-dideoxygalactose transaminase n=1 Tax=Pontibacter chinhatensis TaxID=1436961 RepID=A0A1I2XIV0_9BACT|nr:DegT/DnrJ/EryC1/StrS family aminotransferase [Pontibacter chinhatensis]SFH12636.1 dTDP-4-amino-4,6-dideoxygalactose transaminase [Pontibacter chinhatensis]